MKSICVKAFGGRENLVLVDSPTPVVGSGEALIAVHAIGVGYVDVMSREGEYAPFPKPGFVPGLEVAGTVEAIGDGVAKQWLGRRVFAMPMTGGGYAEKVSIPADSLIPLPDSIAEADAVALGINALVAQIAIKRASLAAGESVLVRGASGGIGLMATQLAALHSKQVTAVTSSVERGMRLKELGASKILDRRSGEDAQAGDYDVIIDTVGGPALAGLIGELRANGRYVLCGGVGGMPPADFGMSLLANYHKSPTFFAFSLNSIGADQLRREAAELFEKVATGTLRSIIDSISPLKNAADAHRKLEEGQAFGKLVLTV